MKFIDADKLIAEIEFAKSVYDNSKRVIHGLADAFRQDGRAAMCDDILKKIASLQQKETQVDKMLCSQVWWEEQGWIMIPPDATIEGIDSLLKQVKKKLQQEQPDKYETALEKAREWMQNVNQGGHAILINIFPELGEGLDPRYGGRKREQPEVDLEKELIEWHKRHFEKTGTYEKYSGFYLENSSQLDLARHFYELGLNARKV